MRNNKYITTTLPYANSSPHIGHAFEFIIADALVRYFRQSGSGVFFNIGLDEHGLKIQRAATLSGVTPQTYVDKLYENWKAFLEIFEIDSYDNFYRTSDAKHVRQVQEYWQECLSDGDIYKKKYSGTYCVGCESFKTERELIDSPDGAHDTVFTHPENAHVDPQIVLRKVCPDHPTTKLQEVEEENYFYNLSKYRNKLSAWAYKSVEFIEPKSKRAEFLGFIDNIQDISISRESDKVSWGVPVPGDETQTVYVWFDALLNYIFAAGAVTSNPDGTEDMDIFDRLWNDSDVIQICGPDNLKFQAVIFQGLLESGAFKHTDKLLVHGTILDKDGHKMSKSVGNVVDPVAQVMKYGLDAVRYYALAGLRTYGNSSWDEQRLVELYNSHLADDFGNLVARVTHLAGKILEEYSDDPSIELDYSYVDTWVTLFNNNIDTAVKPLWKSYKVSEALEETNILVKRLNKKFGDEEPWKNGREGWITVLEIHYAISKINDLYYPVIPGKVDEVKTALRECKKAIIFPKLEIKNKEKC